MSGVVSWMSMVYVQKREDMRGGTVKWIRLVYVQKREEGCCGVVHRMCWVSTEDEYRGMG